MDPATKELVDILGELSALLEKDGDTHWSTWMRRAMSRLKDLDYSGIEYLLSAYGGMGSFNDFVLGQTQLGGQPTWKSGHIELNDQLDKLRSGAWELAQRIKTGRSDVRA